MSKGAYDVNDPYVGPSKDASFRSCICAMLVFISICGIIIIVTTVMRTSNGKTKDYPDNTHADSILGNKEEVESIKPQGVDSLTTSRSGKLNLASTTTTSKPVYTSSSIEKTENPLKNLPETTTLSQTATLSTNKPVPESVNELTTQTSDTITENTKTESKETLEGIKNNQDKLKTTENTDTTTQQSEDQGGSITTTEHTDTTTQQSEDQGGSITTTEHTDITTQTQKNDEATGNKDSSVSNNSQNKDKLTTDSPTTENTDTTTQQSEDQGGSITTTEHTNITTQTQKNDEATGNKDSSVSNNSQNKDKLTTDSPTTENTDTITQQSEDQGGSITTTEHTVITTLTQKNEEATGNKDSSVSNNSQNKDKLTTDSPTTENTDTTTQQSENQGGSINPTQSTTQKSTTELTDTTTQKQKKDVATENEDKLTTDSPTTENTDTTTQQSEDQGESITTTTQKQKYDVATENKNSSVSNNSQNKDKLTTDSPETTTEDTDTTTQQAEDQARTIYPNPTQSATQKSTTEHTDTTTQKQKTDVPTENEDSSVSNNLQTVEPTTQQTQETTTESKDITLEDTKNKKLLGIGNQEKLTTDNPEITTTTSDSDVQKGTEEKDEPTTTEQQIHTTVKPSEEEPTRQSTYKRLTPAPGERTSTIVETEEIVEHRSTESLEINPAEDPCGEECKTIGARMLSRMNHSGDACEHFYDYACGGDNIDNTPEDNWKRIVDGLDRINSESPDVYKTFKRFYKSCVDFHVDYDYNRRVEEAIHMITSVGQANIDNIGDKSALTDLLTQLLLLDSSPLFDISVDVDKESEYFIFQLNLGKQFSTFSDKYTSLTTRRKCLEKSKTRQEFSMSHFNTISLNDMYKEYLDCKKTETYKLETVEKALNAAGMAEDYEDILTYIPKILDQTKGLPSPAVVRNNIITRQFETRKVSELELHYPSIEWKKLLTNLVGKEVHDEDKVQVYFKDIFTQLFGPKTMLDTTTLHEGLLGMYAHDLFTNYILPTPINNPEDFCLKHSSDLMKEVASSLFLESIDPKNTNDPKQIEIKEDLKRIEDLFTKMKIKMSDLINEANWLDHITKNSMASKLNNMEFDSWNRSTIWRNMSLVKDRMKDIEQYEHYSNFTVALVKRNRKLLYSMWKTKAYNEENVWWHFITPYSTSPKSTYSMNRVFVPPGALLTKSEKMPKYLSLVKLGFQLAKSIAHHFDYFGSSGYTGITKQAYKETKECILQSYSIINGTEYDGKYLQTKVVEDSFLLSLNDRYAEDLAITLLYTMSPEDMRGYTITWFSENKAFNNEKLFFIALGQEHCKKQRWEDFFVDFFESEQFSTPLLLDNSLSHYKSFSEIFECNAGSRMNPGHRCKPFPLNEEPEYDYDLKK